MSVRVDDMVTQGEDEVPDLEKKHRAMGLISEAPIWGSMAHLLGTADGVSYTDWREAMLRKEEEFEQNGSMAGQQLADELHGARRFAESALPATVLHQTLRGSGFTGGRLIPRGSGSRNGAVCMQFMRRGRMGQHQGQFSNRGMHTQHGSNESLAGARRRRGSSSRGDLGRSMNYFTCGGFGHVSAKCPSDFQGMCHSCGQWGHQSRFCTTQHAHVSTDEFERAQDGYAYNPSSDY